MKRFFFFFPHSLLVIVLSCSALSRMRVFFVLCCLGVDNRLLHVPLCMHVCWVFVLAHLRWSGSARRCSFRRRGASTGSRSPWNLSTRRCEKQENTTKGKRETDEPTFGEWPLPLLLCQHFSSHWKSTDPPESGRAKKGGFYFFLAPQSSCHASVQMRGRFFVPRPAYGSVTCTGLPVVGICVG